MLIPQQHELWDARLVVPLVYSKLGIHNFHILDYIYLRSKPAYVYQLIRRGGWEKLRVVKWLMYHIHIWVCFQSTCFVLSRTLILTKASKQLSQTIRIFWTRKMSKFVDLEWAGMRDMMRRLKHLELLHHMGTSLTDTQTKWCLWTVKSMAHYIYVITCRYLYLIFTALFVKCKKKMKIFVICIWIIC